jgi:hypothetical protein
MFCLLLLLLVAQSYRRSGSMILTTRLEGRTAPNSTSENSEFDLLMSLDKGRATVSADHFAENPGWIDRPARKWNLHGYSAPAGRTESEETVVWQLVGFTVRRWPARFCPSSLSITIPMPVLPVVVLMPWLIYAWLQRSKRCSWRGWRAQSRHTAKQLASISGRAIVIASTVCLFVLAYVWFASYSRSVQFHIQPDAGTQGPEFSFDAMYGVADFCRSVSQKPETASPDVEYVWSGQVEFLSPKRRPFISANRPRGFLGLAYRDIRRSFPVNDGQFAFNVHNKDLFAPLWMLVALAATPLLHFLLRLTQRRKKLIVGKCENCGYDMRATPSRCPECGRTCKTIQPAIATDNNR